MTEENEKLLLKDLSARLTYGVKFRYKYVDNFFHETYGTSTLTSVHPPYRVEHSTLTGNEYLQIEKDEIKPYLFPLSSMTEEQRKEYERIIYKSIELHCKRYYNVIDVDDFDCLMDFYHKYHFDYRGLIPLDLAIDATGLNIY